MAVWSKALPPTATCPSPLPVFETWPGHVRKLIVTWSSAVVARAKPVSTPVTTGYS